MINTKWINFATKVLRANLRVLHAPMKLTYVVTKECHSRCLNCHIWKVKPKNELTLDEVASLARNSPFLSWIDFTGGEPTDRKDLVAMVSAFVKYCPNLLLVHFPTNGLKPKKIEATTRELRKLPNIKLVVSVSIDGPPDVNDELRGIPGDFNSAVDTYKRLKEINGVECYIGHTMYGKNVKLLLETKSALISAMPNFSAKDLHVNIPHISQHYYENAGNSNARISGDPITSSTASDDPTGEQLSEPREDLSPSSEHAQTEHNPTEQDSELSPQDRELRADLSAAISSLMDWRGTPILPFEHLERRFHKLALRYLKTGLTPMDCSALMSSCFLSETGDVYPCSIWGRSLGNIRSSNYDLLPLLNSPEARKLRERVLAKDCPNCWTPCEAYPSILSGALRLK